MEHSPFIFTVHFFFGLFHIMFTSRRFLLKQAITTGINRMKINYNVRVNKIYGRHHVTNDLSYT